MGNSASEDAFKETIKNLATRSDLDEKGKKILNQLRKNGKSIMKEAPEVLVQMVMKAHMLIGSPFYMKIIQKMVEKYQAIGRCKGGLLESLMKQMEDSRDWWTGEMQRSPLSEHQEKLLPLIEMLSKVDNSCAFRYRWAGQELSVKQYTKLSDWRCISDRLEMLLSGLKNMPDDGNTVSYMKDVTFVGVLDHLMRIRNANCIPTVMDILRILVVDESTAQHVWTSMAPLYGYTCITLNVMEILCLCAGRGAQPTYGELQNILGRTYMYDRTRNDKLTFCNITRSEELTVTFLKTLIALLKNKHSTCHLRFLGDFYIVSQEMLQLGRQIVHASYGTMDNCLNSGNLIDCMLFSSHRQKKIMEERFIEDSFYKNWLHRSPLHFCVMLLCNESSLKCIPPNIVTKYLNTPDMHGCTPLHLAHLHHNKQAVQFLMDYGAKQDVTDKFGMSPKSLESPDTAEDHPDFKYKELCHSVLEAKCRMRSLLVHSEVEAKALSDEVKTLFERLVRGTQYKGTQISTAGSMREKLKAGRLDEVDVHLKFHDDPIQFSFPKPQRMAELLDCLRRRLAEISWEGINLRPISVHGPWKFLREGVTVSLDVVALIDYGEEITKEYGMDGKYITQEVARGLQGELLEGECPLHERMEYCVLHLISYLNLNPTYCAYEWDMIDSLPASCRLAIVIAKSLVQAYDLCMSDKLRVQMPITSYTIKIALFYILAYNSSQLQFNGRDIQDIETKAEVLRNALCHVEGKKSEVKTRASKLAYNPSAQPRWLTDEDVDQYGEEARVVGRKIFTLIKCLAQGGWKLNSYWDRSMPIDIIKDYGEVECICDVCDCALECLNHVTL